MKRNRTTRRSLLLGGAAAIAAPPCAAQNFPSKPLRIVVPYSPGGGADTTARLVAPKLQEVLGETVVIDNRPGAGGMIGDEVVAKSPADGYTLLLGAFAHAVNPSLQPRMPFKTPDDFAPISLLVTVPELLVITPSQSGQDRRRSRRNGEGPTRTSSSMPRRATAAPSIWRASCSSCAPAPISATSPTRAVGRQLLTSRRATCRSTSAICRRPGRRPRPAACARSPSPAPSARPPRPRCRRSARPA